MPLYSGRETTFACHVQPVGRYKIYDVEYSLVWQGNSVNDRRLAAVRRVDVKRRHPLKAVDVLVNHVSLPFSNYNTISIANHLTMHLTTPCPWA